jgi:hypothetical protein
MQAIANSQSKAHPAQSPYKTIKGRPSLIHEITVKNSACNRLICNFRICQRGYPIESNWDIDRLIQHPLQVGNFNVQLRIK